MKSKDTFVTPKKPYKKCDQFYIDGGIVKCRKCDTEATQTVINKMFKHKHQWRFSNFRDCPDCFTPMYYCDDCSCRYYKCSKCEKLFEIIDGKEILKEH